MSRRAWRIGGLGFIAVGVIMLGVAAWVLIGTNVVADRQQRVQVEGLRQTWRQQPPVHLPVTPPKLPALGRDFAVIRIPSIGVVAPVRQGVREDDLEHGVGHYPGSVAPGAMGNFALAGHRTTYGRPFWDIDKLKVGDKIYIDTAAGTFTYVVTKHAIIGADDWNVVTTANLASPKQRALTITTCHPRFSASQRYMIRAMLAVPPAA